MQSGIRSAGLDLDEDSDDSDDEEFAGNIPVATSGDSAVDVVGGDHQDVGDSDSDSDSEEEESSAVKKVRASMMMTTMMTTTWRWWRQRQ